MPLPAMMSAMLLMMFSLTAQPYLFQLFQPIGGRAASAGTTGAIQSPSSPGTMPASSPSPSPSPSPPASSPEWPASGSDTSSSSSALASMASSPASGVVPASSP